MYNIQHFPSNVIKNFNKSLEMSFAMYDSNFPLRCQHFSFIFYKNTLVSVGKNSPKTTPINILNQPLNRSHIIHYKGSCAEWNSINKLKNLTNIPFNKCILINTRINRNGEIAYAKPCLWCRNLLIFIDLKSVYYTGYFWELVQYS